MQVEEVRRIREKWDAKDNPPCNHPKVGKRYPFGADFKNYVCTTCGKNFTPDEFKVLVLAWLDIVYC